MALLFTRMFKETRLLNDCTIAIIAGGKSKRFGSPKYRAKIGNLRLIDMALSVARQLSPNVMIISGLEAIKQEFDLPVYSDEFPDCGPLAGIHSALLHASTEWVAVLPVDMPLLKADFYIRLQEQRKANMPVVAKTDKGLEPMISLWPRSVIPTIERALQNRQFKIHFVLNELSAVHVAFPPKDRIHFFNVNFESDLNLIQALVSGKNS